MSVSRKLAAVRVRSGYRQIHVFLRREGWPVNHKQVYRLYTEEGLTLKRRRPKRHRSAAARQQPAARVIPQRGVGNGLHIHHTLVDGRTIRLLTVIDVFTRECVALEAAPAFGGRDVARILGSARATRWLPERLRVDHGTEFTSKALDHWAY